MGKKSLSESARSVLMKESNDPTPDRDATKKTANAQTLNPSAGVLPSEPDPKSNEAEQLNGQPPVGLDDGEDKNQNLGAKAATPLGKDPSKSGQSPNPSETFGLREGEDELEFEISEELQAFIDDLVAEGKSDDEIATAIAENFEIVEDENENETDIHEAAQALLEKNKERLREHVDALLEGENLSEEFREKATTIFDAAVTERLNEEVAVLEEAYTQALEEEVARIHEDLKKRADDYINYVVEQWVIENQVALDSGLRNELTEEFITGLRNLFLEHYIDVPEDKVDVVEALGSEVAQLKAKLNEEIEKNLSLSKSINESKKVEVISRMCESLTTTQAEKLRSLSENIEFADIESFETKVKTLKENYFPTNAPVTSKALDNEPDAASKGEMITESNSRMDRYARVLGKQTRR